MTFRSLLTIKLLLALFTFTAVALASAAWQGSGGDRKAPRELESVALDKVAKRQQARAEDLEIRSSATMRLPVAGKVAHQYSIRNKRDGTSHEILLDEYGNELDREQLVETERAAHAAKYGKLDEALAERLEKAEANDLIPVQIEIAEPDDDELPKLPTMTRERWNKMTEQEKKAHEDREDEIMRRRREWRARRARERAEPVVERLRRLGYESRPSQGEPSIYVDLRPKLIKQVESWPEVQRISLSGTGQAQRAKLASGSAGPRVAQVQDTSGVTLKSITRVERIAELDNQPGIEIELYNPEPFYVGGLEWCLRVGKLELPLPLRRSADNRTLTYGLRLEAWKRLKDGDPLSLSWGCGDDAAHRPVPPFARLKKKMLRKRRG